MLGSIGPVVGSISAVPGSLRVILGSIGAGVCSIGAVLDSIRAVLAIPELYRAALDSIGVVPGSIGVVSSSIGAVGGGRSFSMACRCRVVVALRWGRMYVSQVGRVVLYLLEGGGLERAGNSGWVVTVWPFGVFTL